MSDARAPARWRMAPKTLKTLKGGCSLRAYHFPPGDSVVTAGRAALALAMLARGSRTGPTPCAKLCGRSADRQERGFSRWVYSLGLLAGYTWRKHGASGARSPRRHR
eukprot:9054527-Pyramimonas_sp.AAC.1